MPAPLSALLVRIVVDVEEIVRDAGAYAPEEPDLEFWGKYGPPPKLSKEEEAKILEEEAALWESLKKKK